MKITSAAFEHKTRIPEKYTADGQNVSPPLQWEQVPEGTKSFVLIADDPDAPGGTFVHWVIYNISASRTELTEDIPNDKEVLDTAKQGANSFGKIGYGGPAPPPGAPHRYFFKLYAVNKMLDLETGAEKEEVLNALEGHIIGESQVMGKYQR